ncbi:hypothetical protein OROMI_006358 [Orobanche minor]
MNQWSINTNSLRSILDKEKLSSTNYLAWSRNLRIVLKAVKKQYILENLIPDEPESTATKAQKDAYNKHVIDSLDVTCLMLATMNSELQIQFEDMEAYEMMGQLKEMFQEQARQERFATTKALNGCKISSGTSVSVHVLKMKGHIEHLERLGAPISQELATDMILASVPSEYDQFVVNFNMHNMEKTITELHGMLKQIETNIKNVVPNVLMVQINGIKRKGIRWPRKIKVRVKSKCCLNPNLNLSRSHRNNPKRRLASTAMKETGHWKRNCKFYLEEMRKRKSGETATSAHIYVNIQGLRMSRQLTKGEIDLRVGNKARVAAIAVGTYDIKLPSGLIL